MCCWAMLLFSQHSLLLALEMEQGNEAKEKRQKLMMAKKCLQWWIEFQSGSSNWSIAYTFRLWLSFWKVQVKWWKRKQEKLIIFEVIHLVSLLAPSISMLKSSCLPFGKILFLIYMMMLYTCRHRINLN